MQILRDTLGIEVPAADTDLIETGLLDSLAVVTLVAEIELLTGIQIPFETLDLDALRSVDAVSDLVARLEHGAL
jgi:D-alanine--poly(phosphoribitol) ligase subunit 2